MATAELPRGAAVALIAGARGADGRWSVGLAVALPPGFKTYWRVPGDSGVAPRFDWQGSANLKAAAADFPAPARYDDEGGETIGYAASVILPLTITPADSARPVALTLALDIAICEDICIPAHASLALTLDPAAAADADSAARIAAARALVPAAPPPGGLTISEARLAGDSLELSLSEDSDPAQTDIFIEGPPLLSFARPESLDGAGRRYRIAVSGLAPQDIAALKGSTVTATLVSGAIRLALPLTVN